jgi:hypothetical protein
MSETREEQRTLALPPATRSRVLNRLLMRVAEGPDAGKLLEHYQEGTVTVGTASDAELRLSDPTVSSYHLEVRPSERGIQLLDLGSLNGTFVYDLARGHVLFLPRLPVDLWALFVSRLKSPDPPAVPSPNGAGEPYPRPSRR